MWLLESNQSVKDRPHDSLRAVGIFFSSKIFVLQQNSWSRVFLNPLNDKRSIFVAPEKSPVQKILISRKFKLFISIPISVVILNFIRIEYSFKSISANFYVLRKCILMDTGFLVEHVQKVKGL